MRGIPFAILLIWLHLAWAGGLDLSLGVREGVADQFLPGVGLVFDLDPLVARVGVCLGAPSGALVEAGLDYLLDAPLVNPYLGAGAALGLTAREGSGDYRLAPGEVGYALLRLGVALPKRGYRPYLEAVRYLGPEPFTRLSMGFWLEVAGW